ITTYNGLESCIQNSSRSFGNDESGCITTTDYSYDEDDSTCCSSSTTNAFGSFSSSLSSAIKKDGDRQPYDGKPNQLLLPDVETMKEKFAKLLLGEDVNGGTKGLCSALAISNAIVNLAATVFGELWKLEPLSEEKKRKWRREMDWLLSPTNYMVELVPAKQSCSNGGVLEIMTTKARSDIQMNLPALKKLDSMLLASELLDSMVDTEFWYAEEGGSQAEGRSTRWWLPSPQVPPKGLSDTERKRLLHHGRLTYQVFKAAKMINENVLLEMPIPITIKETLPKLGKLSLGEELYRALTEESALSGQEIMDRLNLKSEHQALEIINRLEAAISEWQVRVSEEQQADIKSPARPSWSFIKDPIVEMEKTEVLVNQAEILVKQIKTKYPNLPLTFIDATKIRYGKDVGHSILEAYSRVLANLAFSILSRIGDVLQEDIMSNPNSPVAMSHLVGARIPGISDSPMLDRVRHSLVHQLDDADGGKTDVEEEEEANVVSSSVSVTPSRSRVWCIGREACRSLSAPNSP
ncbi:hypothetical protein M569_17449, partial [Genlisea aurea]